MRVLLLFFLASSCYGFRILGYFPFPASSHHQTFARLMYELARKGHEIVYFTPVPSRFQHPNLEVIEVENYKEKYLEAVNLLEFGALPIPLATLRLSTAAIAVSEEYFGSEEAQRLIHGNDTFDAVLMESHFAQEAASAFIHKFGCVGIEIATMGDVAWLNELSGIPDNPAYQIDFLSAFSDSMTLGERLHNWYATWSNVLVTYYHLWRMQSIMDQYFNYTGWESRPSINKLASNRSMILVNRDVVLNYPYPQAPHAKDIGGINLVSNKPLPKNIQEFMDSSPNGVIYFSFGSNLNTKTIAGTIGKSFRNVFAKIPQRVVMKWDTEGPNEMPPNVMISKWLPQADILAHNKCVLFVSHGGYNSLMESVYYGVPVLGISFFGDQHKNVKQIATSGIGISLRNDNTSEASISWAINELINNPRYKLEVSKRSRMLRERPRTAAEEAVYWVEFAINYPNALTPRGAFLSFIELHMIDVKLIVLVSIYLIYKFLVVLLSLFKRSLPVKKVKTS